MQTPSMQQIVRELATRNKVYPRWISEGKIAKPQQTIDEIVLVKPFGFWTNCDCSLAEPPTLSSRSPIRATARHTLVATDRRCAEMIDRHCSESQLLLRHAKARHAVVLTERARSFEHRRGFALAADMVITTMRKTALITVPIKVERAEPRTTSGSHCQAV
jgi:hypothetical protein